MAVTYYSGSEPLKISARTVFAAVKSIIDADLEERFLALCEERKAGVSVAADEINLVKQFIFENELHGRSVGAQSIVDSDRCEA